jgi:hypothetical protein
MLVGSGVGAAIAEVSSARAGLAAAAALMAVGIAAVLGPALREGIARTSSDT